MSIVMAPTLIWPVLLTDAELDASAADRHDDTTLCNGCAGSGEGMTDGSTCRACKGSGETHNHQGE